MDIKVCYDPISGCEYEVPASHVMLIETPEQALAVAEAYVSMFGQLATASMPHVPSGEFGRYYDAGGVVEHSYLDTAEISRQINNIKRAYSRLRYHPKQPAKSSTSRAREKRKKAGLL